MYWSFWSSKWHVETGCGAYFGGLFVVTLHFYSIGSEEVGDLYDNSYPVSLVHAAYHRFGLAEMVPGRLSIYFE